MEEISLKKRMVHGVFWLGGTKAIGQAISWILTIYIARILSPADYGLMGMALVFIGFIVLNNELGLGAAIVQKKDLKQDDLSSIYWAIILINIAFYLISFFLSPFIARFFHEPRLTRIIRIIAFIFVINGFGYVSYSLLTREIDFHKRSIAEFVGNLSGSVSTLLFAINGWGVMSLVYGSIILEFTKTALNILLHPFKPKLFFSFRRIHDMATFGLKVFVVKSLSYVYLKTDTFIAGKVLGTTLLGYYAMALNLASLPLDKFVSLVTQVAFPAFSKIQTNDELLRKYFLNIVRVIAFITFPIFIIVFMVADDAVPFFLTEKWSAAIFPLKILCLASCFKAINAMYTPLLLGKGKPDVAMKNQLVFSILLPIGFYIGSLYGLKGLSYSWLIVFPIAFLIVTIDILKVLSISFTDFFKGFRHIFFGAGFMALCVLIVKNSILFDYNYLVRISGNCFTGIFSYILYYFIFNREMLKDTRGILRT